MKTEKARNSLFERLKGSLEQGIAHTRGEMTLKTVEVPEEPPEIDAANLAALRETAEMSQAIFARVLNVSPKTVQSWEHGVRIPSMGNRRLIHIFSQRPEAVCEVVGVPTVKLHGVKIVTEKGKRWIIIKVPRRSAQAIEAKLAKKSRLAGK